MDLVGMVDMFGNFIPNDKEALKNHKGHPVKVKVETMAPKQAESYQQLKMYWAIVKTIVSNTDENNWNSDPKVHTILRQWCGHIEKDALVAPCKTCGTDKFTFIPRSISYKECSQRDRSEYINKAVDKGAIKLQTTPEILMANAEY